MNRNDELKLQSYLDGELSQAEARRVRAWLEARTEAAPLLEELRSTRDLLAVHEPHQPVPETREFYWSRIGRAIEAAEAREARTRPVPWLGMSWRRWLAPLGGLALVILLAVASMNWFDFAPAGPASGQLARVEMLSDVMGAHSFENKAENVFVIWLYERTPQPQSDLSYVKDLVIQ